MDDRISNDHPTIETFDCTIERFGATTRPAIVLPKALDVDAGDLLRVVADGREFRTIIAATAADSLAITALAKSAQLAHQPGSGTDFLPEWIDGRGLDFGRTVHVDVVAPGFRYGLRGPGETATYPTGAPDDGLSSIADQFDWES